MSQIEQKLRTLHHRVSLFRQKREHVGDENTPRGGMDRAIAQQPLWRRYLPYASGGVILLVLLVWLAPGISSHAYRIPLDRVTVGTVTRAPFEDFVAVRATAAPLNTRYLTAEQGGEVKQVLIEDGATVKSGQPLVVLSNAPLQLQVAQREADTAGQINALQDTRLQLEETRFKHQHDLLDIEHQISDLDSNLSRDKILLAGKAIAPATYQQEEAEHTYLLKLREATVTSRDIQEKVRRAQLNQLQETLLRLKDSTATAKASLDALTIRAPTDGQVTALSAEVGQSKSQGAVLGQVDSPDRFKLIAQVDEFYLGRVVAGQLALLNMGGNYQATVNKIYPQIADGTFKVDLKFAGKMPPGLHTGEAVDIRLELGGATTALMLPNGPFYQDTGGRWIFVLSQDGEHASRRTIRLGRRNSQFVEVVEGLEPGEKAIISGYEDLQKVDRIDITPGHR